MSSTPPDAPGPDQLAGPPIPPGYKAGDYIPFKDRDPDNPSSIAGRWADPARDAQQGGGRPMTDDERYRAIYGYDAPARVTYASWGRRVLGYLVDSLFGLVAMIPMGIGYWMILSDLEYTTDDAGNRVISDASEVSPVALAVIGLGALISIVFHFWNAVIRQGRTGYTLGKSVVGIRLVDGRSGQPLGSGMSFLRQLAHIVDTLLCYLGWLWPLWDSRRQTLGDKIVGSVVVIQSPDQVR